MVIRAFYGSILVLVLSISVTAKADKRIQQVRDNAPGGIIQSGFRQRPNGRLSPRTRNDDEERLGRNLGGFRDYVKVKGIEVAPANEPLSSSLCGCNTCTEQVWNTPTDTLFTCGELIEQMTGQPGYEKQEDACRYVGGLKLPQVCGACDPDNCGQPKPDPDIYYCGCPACTQARWSVDAAGVSCGERIEWAKNNNLALGGSQEEACHLVAGIEHQDECGPYCDPELCHRCNDEGCDAPTCGCWDCSEDILESDTGAGITCRDRINNLIGSGNTEIEACALVAGDDEYQDICGPKCDPNSCDGRAPQVAPAAMEGPPCPEMPLTPKSSLYCFPDSEERISWRNVWGKYIVQVKEGICGPGDNLFTRNTVSLKGSNLRLQYKQVNGQWEASEVRILLPPGEMPYSYGTFRFHVKSVEVRNGDRKLISRILPPSLVLGMYTWDPTTNCEGNTDLSREVDIEVSRWGDYNNLDAQFLVQPPEFPQLLRFNTGSPSLTSRVPNSTTSVLKVGRPYDQGGNFYQFKWKPGAIYWHSSAGGGRTHHYSTKQAIQLGLPDRIQCLPAPIEVRINLWNIYSSFVDPIGMAQDDVVTVVVDGFQYIRSSKTRVPRNGYCTKDCQCGKALCIDNKCN